MSTMPGSIEVIEVFCSYAHPDEDLEKELDKHLSGIERQKLITLWSDRKIGPGAEWKGQIDEHLKKAEIILLLISADYIGSDIARLRELHAQMDYAILACYGWEDLQAQHGFHQNERGHTRYTVLPTARREILRWLLKSNAEAAEREKLGR